MNASLTPDQLSTHARAERQAQVVQALLQVLPQHALLYTTEDTVPYECDGLTAYRARPMCVALPETVDQVQAVLKTCYALDVPVVEADEAVLEVAAIGAGAPQPERAPRSYDKQRENQDEKRASLDHPEPAHEAPAGHGGSH